MKSKPIVMEHFSTVHTSFVVDFRFTNNITILTGDSGTGRTTAFSFIQECMPINVGRIKKPQKEIKPW
jgi:predicted ATP-binding protein involved in virulence